MKVLVDAGGRRHAVDVRRAPGAAVAVSVDGRELPVDVHDAGGTFSLIVGTASHDVEFVDGPPGSGVVIVDGRPIPVSIVTPARPWASRADAAPSAGAAGPQRVVAPMPGKVVKVLVTVGDAVGARQGVVVVEAMKMENELRSPRAGTVTEVRVAEGVSVEAGAILVIID